MFLKALTNLPAVKDLTLKKWNKWKSYKQKMKDKIWVWEEIISRHTIKHLLFSNNMLKPTASNWKRMTKIMNHRIKFLLLDEVILLIIIMWKQNSHQTLICSNQVLCKNSLIKVQVLLIFLWTLSLTLLLGWIILFWSQKELYFKSFKLLNKDPMNKRTEDLIIF